MTTGTDPHNRPLLIIGLGNELLADDAIGIRIVRELKRRSLPQNIDFAELAVGGLQLLDYLVGYDRCILVDAVVSGRHAPGTIYRFEQRPGSQTVHLSSSHHVALPEVLALGTMLGADMPERLTVYGIEAEDTTTFTNQCTQHVAKSLPQLANLISRDIQEAEAGSSQPEGEWDVAIHGTLD